MCVNFILKKILLQNDVYCSCLPHYCNLNSLAKHRPKTSRAWSSSYSSGLPYSTGLVSASVMNDG